MKRRGWPPAAALIAVFLTAAWLPEQARADSQSPASVQEFTPAPAPSFTANAATPPPVTSEPERDAHADRVVLLPTAYVHPAGTVTLSSYDIVLLQAGYSITDSTQVALTASPPLDKIVPVDLTLKTVVARDGLVRVAALGSVTGLWGLDQGNLVLGRAGAVTELCFEETCRSSASIAATVLFAGSSTVAMTGVGVVWRVASWAALLLEFDTLLPLGLDIGKSNGIAVLPGVRLPFRTWALDFALARPLGVTGATTIPFLAFTYRFLP